MSHWINYGLFGAQATRWINQQTTAGIVFIVASIVIVFVIFGLWVSKAKAGALLTALIYGVLFGLKNGAGLFVFALIIALLASYFDKKKKASAAENGGVPAESGSQNGSQIQKLFPSEMWELEKMDKRALDVMDPWSYQQFRSEKEAVMTHSDYDTFYSKWDYIIEERTKQKIDSMP